MFLPPHPTQLHPLDNTPRKTPPPRQHPLPLDNTTPNPLDNPPGELECILVNSVTATKLSKFHNLRCQKINSVDFNLFHRNKECALNKGHFYLGFIHSMHIHYLILCARNNMRIHFFMHGIYFGCKHFGYRLSFNILMGKSHCLLWK